MRLKGCELAGRTGHEAGRELLRQLYREVTGEETLPEIRKAENGKPVFRDCPLHFSITHTDRHAFCALSEWNLGIDAEELDRKVNPKLADKILSPAEKARYDAAEDRHRALLTLWVLKEADAKRTGEGIRGFPNKTDFSPDDPRVTERDGCLLAVIEDKGE